MTQTQTPMTPLRNLANNLLITAVEGGINYWAIIPVYEPPGQFDDGFAEVIDNEEAEIAEFNFLGHILNWDEITEAIQKGHISCHTLRPVQIEQTLRSMADNKYDLPRRWQRWALDMLLEPEDADYDAEDADVVAQLTMLGEVVYG